jgi:Na+-transporting NADH:ubiquinone oxidoreductase subunit C
MVICVLWFAIFAVDFLRLKDNFAEPRNEETEAAVLQLPGCENGPADAQTVIERHTRRESSLGG